MDNNYEVNDFTPFSDTTFRTADGQTIRRDISLPFTTQNSRAHKIAAMEVRKSRLATSVVIPCNHSVADIEVNDWIKLYIDPYNDVTTSQFNPLDGKNRAYGEFTITRVNREQNGAITLEADQKDDTIYDSLPTQPVTPVSPPGTLPPPPGAKPTGAARKPTTSCSNEFGRSRRCNYY